MDYRALNAATVRQLWPAARIDNILASFTGAKWFTVLDLNAAFHQIAFSSEQDAELAAFVTENRLYQMRAMPFNLTNAPAIMQRLIDRVLAPHKKYALAYMDDIIVLSPTFEQHLEHASAVLLKTLL
jgi:putative NADPH-quinone reductase